MVGRASSTGILKYVPFHYTKGAISAYLYLIVMVGRANSTGILKYVPFHYTKGANRLLQILFYSTVTDFARFLG